MMNIMKKSYVIFIFGCFILLVFFIAHTRLSSWEIKNIINDKNEFQKTLIQLNQDLTVQKNKFSQDALNSKNLKNQIHNLENQVALLQIELDGCQAKLSDASIIDENIKEESEKVEVAAPDLMSPTNSFRDRMQNLFTPEERAQFEEQMSVRVEQMRTRMADDLNREMAKTKDPIVQDRLAQIQEYSDYNIDLAQQMRDAVTDEDREAIRSKLRENQNYVNALRQEQQNYMLSEVGKQYGVGNSNQQSFINSMRETMDNPMFRNNSSGFGGRRGNFGGERRAPDNQTQP